MMFVVAQLAASLLTAAPVATAPAVAVEVAAHPNAHADTIARGMAKVTWTRATRALRTGDTVHAGDFTLVDTLIVWHYSTPPAPSRAEVGWIARRPIAVGEFMRQPGVAPMPVITLGSTVKVLWQDGVVSLVLTGVATNNAALGAPVGVRIDKNRRLDGIAAGPNTVRLR